MKLKSLLAVLVLALFLGACSLWSGSEENGEKSSGGLFSKITRCEYVDEDGITSVMHIKDEMIYVEPVMDDLDSGILQGLIRDDKMYMWSSNEETGLVFDLAEMAANEEDAMKMKDVVIHNSKEMVEFLQKEGVNCGASSLDASKFELPEGVQFASLQEMMENMFEGMELDMGEMEIDMGEVELQMAE